MTLDLADPPGAALDAAAHCSVAGLGSGVGPGAGSGRVGDVGEVDGVGGVPGGGPGRGLDGPAAGRQRTLYVPLVRGGTQVRADDLHAARRHHERTLAELPAEARSLGRGEPCLEVVHTELAPAR